MTLRYFSVLIILFSTFYFLHSLGVLAQAPTSPDDFLGIQDFTVQKIANIITGFACWLIGIVLAIMVIFLVIAGIRFFLARGNDAAVTEARKNLTWTLVGILVILAVNVIIATVANALGSNYSFIPLNCARVNVTVGRSCSDTNPCPAGQTCSNPDAQGRRICVQ